MSRISVTFDISPATSTTCGDGSGRFCDRCRIHITGWPAECTLFERPLKTDTGDARGWLKRLPECIAAEALR